MSAVGAVLKRHGLLASEEEVAKAMEAVLAQSGFKTPYPAPRLALEDEAIKLLEQGGFEVDRVEFGLEDPIARAAFEYAVLRATGLTTQQAAERLDVNDSRIRQRLGEHRLYGIKVGDEWRLPTFQFSPTGLVPGIDSVFEKLRESLNPVAVFRWFNAPNSDLEDDQGARDVLTPLQWLQIGNDPETVAELAADL